MRAILLFLCLPLFAAGVQARQVSVEWDAVAGADGYRIYSGTASRSYDSVYDAGPAVSYTVTDLDAWQRYYFSVTAYDATTESGFSNEVQLAAVGATVDDASQTCDAEEPIMAVPTITQQKDGPLDTSVASQTVTFDSAVASGAGILVIIKVKVDGNTNDVLDAATVSDGTNTYGLRVTQVRGFSGNGYNFAMYSATALSSSAFAVTVTPEVTATEIRVVIMEIANWSGVPAVTQAIANFSATTVTAVSWDFTNTTSGDYLFIAGAHLQSDATATPDTGWSNLSAGSEMKIISKSATATTPSVNDPGLTLSTARRWVGGAVAIPGGAGAATVSMPPQNLNPMVFLGVR